MNEILIIDSSDRYMKLKKMLEADGDKVIVADNIEVGLKLINENTSIIIFHMGHTTDWKDELISETIDRLLELKSSYTKLVTVSGGSSLRKIGKDKNADWSTDYPEIENNIKILKRKEKYKDLSSGQILLEDIDKLKLKRKELKDPRSIFNNFRHEVIKHLTPLYIFFNRVKEKEDYGSVNNKIEMLSEFLDIVKNNIHFLYRKDLRESFKEMRKLVEENLIKDRSEEALNLLKKTEDIFTNELFINTMGNVIETEDVGDRARIFKELFNKLQVTGFMNGLNELDGNLKYICDMLEAADKKEENNV